MMKIYKFDPDTGLFLAVVSRPIDVKKTLAIKTTVYADIPANHTDKRPIGDVGECNFLNGKWVPVQKEKPVEVKKQPEPKKESASDKIESAKGKK